MPKDLSAPAGFTPNLAVEDSSSTEGGQNRTISGRTEGKQADQTSDVTRATVWLVIDRGGLDLLDIDAIR